MLKFHLVQAEASCFCVASQARLSRLIARNFFTTLSSWVGSSNAPASRHEKGVKAIQALPPADLFARERATDLAKKAAGAAYSALPHKFAAKLSHLLKAI